jgi:hypothetical protein
MWARDVEMISDGNEHFLAVSPSSRMMEHEDSLLFHTAISGGNAEGANWTATESGNKTKGFSVDVTLHCTIDIIVPFVPVANYSDDAPVALEVFNLTQSKGETRTPPTLVIEAAVTGAFLRIGSVSVSFPDHATATVEAFHASIGSMVVEAASTASVQLEDVNIETSLRIEAEKVHGYLAASLRGSNYLSATQHEQAATATSLPSCKRAGSVVSSSSGPESVFWLFPAVNQTSDSILSGEPATIIVKSSSPDSRFLVDVTEGQCGTYRQQTDLGRCCQAANALAASSVPVLARNRYFGSFLR